MTCEPEEQALADIRKHKLNAELHLQQKKVKAESALLRSNESIYDWRAVRIAEALMRCWNERCAHAENVRAQCKERKKKQQRDWLRID